ncbi:hypothetical protein [Vibrio crassostreae]|uniref:hypothetical protein n=1 Tax=Vibrio crassostreae TaxID=246167 RepID=UPI001B318751|nr:hypothetical protein [Vibrio crassostreae]
MIVVLTKNKHGIAKRLVTVDENGSVSLFGSKEKFSEGHFFEVNERLVSVDVGKACEGAFDGLVRDAKTRLRDINNACPVKDENYISCGFQAADIERVTKEITFLEKLA